LSLISTIVLGPEGPPKLRRLKLMPLPAPFSAWFPTMWRSLLPPPKKNVEPSASVALL
jgi:hypothetical protein